MLRETYLRETGVPLQLRISRSRVISDSCSGESLLQSESLTILMCTLCAWLGSLDL